MEKINEVQSPDQQPELGPELALVLLQMVFTAVMIFAQRNGESK